MAALPSYHEATARPHWITLVAPYVSVRDYTSLCLVNTRFFAQFGPRIWKDPFETISLLGRDPANDTRRVHYFLTQHVENMRLATRLLVLCLDFRNLDLESYDFFERQLWHGGKSKEMPSRLASAFPNLRCILLDGAPDWLADSVVNDLQTDQSSSAPWGCLMFAAPKMAIYQTLFLLSPQLESLVYLDLSYAPGPLNATVLTACLPRLRMLKVQGRELGDENALSLVSLYKRQLWSLDLSDNRLTDAILEPMALSSFPITSFRNGTHNDVEGRLKWAGNLGSSWYGHFGFLQESEHSSAFNHPRRHLVDPPVYTRDASDPPMYTRHSQPELVEQRYLRHDGRRPVRQDCAEGVKAILLGHAGQLPETVEDMRGHEMCASHGGITHLRLNGNNFSLHGVERMIRECPGQLEHFECDTVLIDLPRSAVADGIHHNTLPRRFATARVTGFIGASHLFRPAFCPQLQVLRVHHSLVTRVPSIEEDTVTVGESLWIAERLFEPRAALAFPQVFAPDMNPRLYSLTLTDVPRWSSGSLIEKLVSFLQQASIQEREIQDANAAHAHRVSATVRGLRHLHLEFGQDPAEVAVDALDLEELDATELLSLEDKKQFSFFGQSGWTSCSPPSNANGPQVWIDGRGQKNEGSSFHDETPLFSPGNPPPYRPGYAETTDEFEQHRGDWNGQVFTIPVWVGRAVPGPHTAVNEYRRLLNDPHLVDLHTNVGPASPSHVLAGVPAGFYIYHAAWNAIMTPPIVRKPTQAELGEMHDVVAAIKAYRGKTKAAQSAAQRAAGTTNVPLGHPHNHWSGKLEISFPSVSHSSGMWR
ncbi:hypothetical protein GE09DRAFT_1167549 [Coniochaeta sp. 2T2.1]|nr:hypothetical protein GE09DRAFT_1167549 [Coniochaeta sp. 2T2.1]